MGTINNLHGERYNLNEEVLVHQLLKIHLLQLSHIPYTSGVR